MFFDSQHTNLRGPMAYRGNATPYLESLNTLKKLKLNQMTYISAIVNIEKYYSNHRNSK